MNFSFKTLLLTLFLTFTFSQPLWAAKRCQAVLDSYLTTFGMGTFENLDPKTSVSDGKPHCNMYEDCRTGQVFQFTNYENIGWGFADNYRQVNYEINKDGSTKIEIFPAIPKLNKDDSDSGYLLMYLNENCKITGIAFSEDFMDEDSQSCFSVNYDYCKEREGLTPSPGTDLRYPEDLCHVYEGKLAPSTLHPAIDSDRPRRDHSSCVPKLGGPRRIM